MADLNLIAPFAKYANGKRISIDVYKHSDLLVSYPTWMKWDTAIIDSTINSFIARGNESSFKLLITDVCEAGLTKYNGSGHLLTPVIDSTERFLAAMMWLIKEIRKRHELFSDNKVKNIQQYNEKAGFMAMQYILCVTVDISNLFMIAPSKVFELITNVLKSVKGTGVIFVATTKHPRDSMSKMFSSHVFYKANDEVGIVRYMGRNMSEPIKVKLIS